MLPTAHAMESRATALGLGGEPAVKQNLAQALPWMVAAQAEKTQDKVFKMLAYCRYGGAAAKTLARQLCQVLLGDQQSSARGGVIRPIRRRGTAPSPPGRCFARCGRRASIRRRLRSSAACSG